MIQQTSFLAYNDLKYNLGERQLYVLDLVKNIPDHTALELAKYDGKDTNFVRPRLTELYKMGIIYINGKRNCKVSGRLSYVWRLKCQNQKR